MTVLLNHHQQNQRKQLILRVVQCQHHKIHCTVSIAQCLHCDKETEHAGKVSGDCCAQGRMRCFFTKCLP